MKQMNNQKVTPFLLTDDTIFPNNPEIPLIIYENVFLEQTDPETIEAGSRNNKWKPAWRYWVYPYHHYHSTAHEFLGCYQGQARIRFGGDNGLTMTVSAGDAVLIPAGVAHKSLSSSGDFMVVGAYPSGQHPDMNYGKPGERPGVDNNILNLSIPAKDPVCGLAWTDFITKYT